jgi:hypothetical protein
MALLIPATAIGLVILHPVQSWIRQIFRSPESVMSQLPIQVGYTKGPVDGWSLAHCYARLVGWDALTWELPVMAVGLAGLACAAVLLSLVAVTPGVRHRTLLLALGLLPCALWLATPVVNALSVRWMLPSVMTLSLGLGILFQRARTGRRDRVVFALMVVVWAAAAIASVRAPCNPPLADFVPTLRAGAARELAVSPGWHAPLIRFELERHGLSLRAFPCSAASGKPEWLLVRDPIYTWPNPRKLFDLVHPPLELYDEVLRVHALRQDYFHGPRITDRLFRLRGAPTAPAVPR